MANCIECNEHHAHHFDDKYCWECYVKIFEGEDNVHKGTAVKEQSDKAKA